MRLVVNERANLASMVARSRSLYLGHLGAEIGQQLGAVRARDMVSQVENLDAVKGCVRQEATPGLVVRFVLAPVRLFICRRGQPDDVEGLRAEQAPLYKPTGA